MTPSVDGILLEEPLVGHPRRKTNEEEQRPGGPPSLKRRTICKLMSSTPYSRFFFSWPLAALQVAVISAPKSLPVGEPVLITLRECGDSDAQVVHTQEGDTHEARKVRLLPELGQRQSASGIPWKGCWRTRCAGDLFAAPFYCNNIDLKVIGHILGPFMIESHTSEVCPNWLNGAFPATARIARCSRPPSSTEGMSRWLRTVDASGSQ